MRAALITLARRAAPDVFFIAGIGAVVHGVAAFSPPAAWIVAGLLCMAVAAGLARRERTP